MKSKCLKQSLVAEKAGYTEQQLSNMLNGRKIIKDEDMLRIAKALDVEIGELFGKEEKS
jgi:transcriptional regulator with XRE-family HTH domain